MFGVPIGAVGAMTVQRTLDRGFGAGLLTGLGSSVADCLYACIGVFGLTFISDFLLKYRTLINIIGGVFVLIMGISQLVKKPAESAQQGAAEGAKIFLSSFVVGITNPAAILTFLFAFTYFGIAKISGALNGILLVSGVFIGTYIWWSTLSGTVCFIKSKTGNRGLLYINKIFGVILILFAAVIFVKIFLWEGVRMRKIFLIFLAAAMAFATACSNSEGSGVDSTPTISSDTSQGADSSASGDKSESANTSSEPISELSEEQSSTEPKLISTNESTNYTNTSADTPSSTTEQSSSITSSLTSSTSSISSSLESSVSTTSAEATSTTIELPESSNTASDNSQAPEPPTDKKEDDLNITVTVNGRAFSATLYDNETAKAFKERLPLTLDMSELNGNEKYYYLPKSLPRNSSRPSAINAGDIMLYGSDCLVVFYESFSTSYSYTPIEKIDDPDGLAAVLGSGSVQVEFD